MSNLLTDYLLVLVIGMLAVDIHRRQYLGDFRLNTAWVVSFFLFALAAFLGGTYHGMFEGGGVLLAEVIWFSSIACIQLASFALAVTVLEQFLTSVVVRRTIEVVLLVKLIVILGLLTVHPQFIYVMVGYGIDLLVVLTVLFYLMVRQPSVRITWLFTGALIVPIASLIQRIPVTVLGFFDQNDIYHFVLIGAFVCLHQGVKRSNDTTGK